MSLLIFILILTATFVPTVTGPGCPSGVASSAHITIFAECFQYLGNLDDFHVLRRLVETFNASSYHVTIDLYSYDPARLGDHVRESHALAGARYSVGRDYVITYVNSMTWQPPPTDRPTSHVLILLLDRHYPHIFMYPKIQRLKRAGMEIFTVVYGALKVHEMDDVASYPAAWHSYSRLSFQSSEDVAEALIRSVCRSIEAKERVAKKELLAEVRLAGGGGACDGWVELLYKETWGSLSDGHWDRPAADVLCRQLGCGPSLEAVRGGAPGSGLVLEKVDCTGDEDDASQCLLTPRTNGSSRLTAGVTCLPSGATGVRLVNGSGRCDGEVEVSVGRGGWTRVSLWSFDVREGALVCRDAGCGPLRRIRDVVSPSGAGTVRRSRCSGAEPHFSGCSIGMWAEPDHLPPLHAAVQCEETAISKVSVSGASGPCSGKVKVFYNEMWSAVCAMDWSAAEEAVLCKQLGCGPALELLDVKKVDLNRGATPLTNIRSVYCTGSEGHLSQCAAVVSAGYKCYSGEALLSCSQTGVSDVRLVDGPHSCSGRVEVQYKKRWGTVCDQHWDLSDAEVVCRQVGCGPAVRAPGGAYFGSGSGDIWLEKVFCNGTEAELSLCGALVSKKSLCVHSQDASVVCEEKSKI